MPGTVTVAEVLAVANGQSGRGRLVLDAILEALQTNLPAVLTDQDLPAIKGWFWAGEDIHDGNVPAVVVSQSTTKEPFGTGYKSVMHVVVSCVYPARLTRSQWQTACDTADLIQCLLFTKAFNGPYRRVTAGPNVWHALIPKGTSPLPTHEGQDYGGFAAHFECWQNPPGATYNNLWPTTP